MEFQAPNPYGVPHPFADPHFGVWEPNPLGFRVPPPLLEFETPPLLGSLFWTPFSEQFGTPTLWGFGSPPPFGTFPFIFGGGVWNLAPPPPTPFGVFWYDSPPGRPPPTEDSVSGTFPPLCLWGGHWGGLWGPHPPTLCCLAPPPPAAVGHVVPMCNKCSTLLPPIAAPQSLWGDTFWEGGGVGVTPKAPPKSAPRGPYPHGRGHSGGWGGGFGCCGAAIGGCHPIEPPHIP